MLTLKKVLENTKIYDFLLTLLTHINHSTVPHKIYLMKALAGRTIPTSAVVSELRKRCGINQKLLYYYKAETLLQIKLSFKLKMDIHYRTHLKAFIFTVCLSKVCSSNAIH